MKRIGLFIGLIAAIVIGAPYAFVTPAAAAEPTPNVSYYDPTCAPEGKIRFVCGRGAPEDIAPLLGTDWVVISAFTGAVGLRLVSIRHEEVVSVLYPSSDAKKKQDMTTYGACPGPLNAEGEAMFVSHGIYIRKVTDRSFTLYVVHHGSRESVEVFKLDVPRSGGRPLVTWVGCAVAPGQETFNSVALLPDNGFVVSNTFQKSKDFKVSTAYLFDHEFTGDPLGNSRAPGASANGAYLLEWHPGSGWAKVPGSEGTSASCLETSPDGKYIYYCAGDRKFVRLSHGEGPLKRDEVSTGSVAGDNIKWTPDGKKLMLGGGTTSADGQRTGKIVLIDPDTLQVTDFAEFPVGISTAIQIGNDIWIGSARALRVAIMPVPAQP